MNISLGNAVGTIEARPETAPLVLVVDDDESVRLSICELLESVDIETAGFGSTQALLDADILDRPGCMILDVRMPGASGLDFQARLAANGISASIIFLTGHGDIPMTVQAMKAGAVEFLTKPFRDQDLLDAISDAIGRDRTERVQFAEVVELQRRFEELTPREREVMEQVVAGLLNKQIANRLNISEVTVKLHRHQVMEKMKAQSLAELVRMAEKLNAQQA